MKTIFVFNNSRPTDDLTTILALGEDGQAVARIQFDRFTLPFCQFAMGTSHYLQADDSDIADEIQDARARVLIRYSEMYGIANWMPMWLDAPLANPACVIAIRRFSEYSGRRSTVPARSFGADAITAILRDIFRMPAAATHSTH